MAVDASSGDAGAFAIHQYAAQDLAGRGLGDRIDELHALQPLVVGDLPVNELDDFLRCQLSSGHHQSLGALTAFFIGNGYHGCIRDARVFQQQALELRGSYLVPFDLDQLLQAVDDREIPLGVDRADVACVQPTLLVDGVRGRLGIVQVALHHLRAAYPDLAGFADSSVVTRLYVDEATLRRGCEPSHRAGSRLAPTVRIVRHGARLGHAITLADGDIQPPENGVGELGAQRRCTAEQLLQVTQVVLVYGRVLGEQHRDRRHDMRQLHPPVLQRFQEQLGVEARQRDDGCADPQTEVQDDDQAIDVEE